MALSADWSWGITNEDIFGKPPNEEQNGDTFFPYSPDNNGSMDPELAEFLEQVIHNPDQSVTAGLASTSPLGLEDNPIQPHRRGNEQQHHRGRIYLSDLYIEYTGDVLPVVIPNNATKSVPRRSGTIGNTRPMIWNGRKIEKVYVGEGRIPCDQLGSYNACKYRNFELYPVEGEACVWLKPTQEREGTCTAYDASNAAHANLGYMTEVRMKRLGNTSSARQQRRFRRTRVINNITSTSSSSTASASSRRSNTPYVNVSSSSSSHIRGSAGGSNRSSVRNASSRSSSGSGTTPRQQNHHLQSIANSVAQPVTSTRPRKSPLLSSSGRIISSSADPFSFGIEDRGGGQRSTEERRASFLDQLNQSPNFDLTDFYDFSNNSPFFKSNK